MNFDTKYVIRWGFPGWVFILFTYITFVYYEGNSFLGNEFTITQLLGILISLGFVGVVFGYLMHHIYFSFNWIFSQQSSKILESMDNLIENKELIKIDNADHDDYFELEFNWHKLLLLIDDKQREYITERYRYMLSTIHGLGAMLVSIVITLGTMFLIVCIHPAKEHPFIPLFLFLLLTYVGIAVYNGFKYYSNNLIHFQASFINSFHKNELKKSQEIKNQ